MGSTRQRGRLAAVAAWLAAEIVFLAACGGGGPGGGGLYGGNGGGDAGGEGGGEGTVTITGEQANDHGTVNAAGKSSVKVELGEFFFEPTVLKGDPGQSLTVELENVGQVVHTFTLSGQGIDETVQPGQTATAQVTLPQSGKTAFICQFHEAQNMRGGLDAGGTGSGGGAGSGDNQGGSGGY